MQNLHKHWKLLMILTVIVGLLSIKGFPIALGALYLPVLFRVVKLQMNLSKGLINERDPQMFIKSNQKGVIISVVCCIAITFILMKAISDFYAGLTGFLGTLIAISPVTLAISIILYILSAIAVIQAVKLHFGNNKIVD
ncbi:hypothetical protein CD149_09975 [Staphylococcus condimenti]|uniref:Uncharacterized protein n=1 Tax=Staphylococcus condimenti TaxID=70255 RepID=A0A143P8B1_9STAP|nr:MULTISPECIES: hypothetical protein [Staphylococcus]AMY04453.1 hypothetical protein A4G25_00350 [Staphylococcus condimenti]APR60690.1 hypothetical protein BTZ13_05590 [Staphylococcus condimenti]MDK8646269.1 hypothetical protein [Staphylococcus condimenti]OFP01698.1 hypothetical protein HMPREF3007_04170 [Staphylococcus sp. HMSC065E08]PNZ58654.1 hypothetical protein CD149_09975 [Staphylococcus condimenti]